MNFRLSIISITLFFIFLSSKNTYAQYEDLHKDPAITWIAEFNMDYSFSLTADLDH